MRWDLNVLYSSFDSKELAADLEKANQLMNEAIEKNKVVFSNYDNVEEKLVDYLKEGSELMGLLSRIGGYGYLVFAVDTTNTTALKLIETYENMVPQLTLINVGFKKWLREINNLDEIVENNNYLKEHKYVISEFLREASHLLTDAEEELLAHMQNTGSNSWTKLQEVLTSHLTVDVNINGEVKTVPLSIARNMAYDPSQEVRKAAYEAELKAYEKVDKSVAAALNAIKGEVITVSKKRRYSSPLEMTLENSRMDKETLDAMLTAIHEYLPYFRKYLNKKSEILGNKDGLPFYDLFAPVGKLDMNYTYEEARDFIVKNFTNFSEHLGNYAKRAFDENWIDAEPREGKRGGAFCSNIHPIKQSRIMANFTGTFNDVTTLAHELGHGYHGENLKDVHIFNSDYPMPIAETASIFCETIVVNSALETATKEEAMAILESSIMSSTQVIVDILSRYIFETTVFEKRQHSSLSVEEFKEAMINAQKEAYGDGLNNELHPYMWLCKPHYYSADYNFYNFPYAFGLLFAKGLYAKYLENKEEFIPKYDALLTATGCNSIRDVLQIMDVDSHSVDFFRGSLEIIKDEIEQFCSL